jgi:hypothetical protein
VIQLWAVLRRSAPRMAFRAPSGVRTAASRREWALSAKDERTGTESYLCTSRCRAVKSDKGEGPLPSMLPLVVGGERSQPCTFQLPVPPRVPDAGALRRTRAGKACFSGRRQAQTRRGPQARGERATAGPCKTLGVLSLSDLGEGQHFLNSVAQTERLLRRCPSTAASQ